MSAELAPGDRAALESIVGQLEAAWNAMDGPAFAVPFAADADFVNIRGEHFQGRQSIAAGHTAIFQTIYAGSTNRYIVETARLVHPEVALLHVHADAGRAPGSACRTVSRALLDGGDEEVRRVGDRVVPQHARGAAGAAPLIFTAAGAISAPFGV